MNIFSKKIFLGIALFCYFVPNSSFAARVFFDVSKSAFNKGDTFLVNVLVDTELVSVNAVEGKIYFPKDTLSLEEIRYANSSVNFWVERPHNLDEGSVAFSGITPGGFSGSKKLLITLVLKSKVIGTGTILPEGFQVLANDGLGTVIATRYTPFNFIVSTGLNTGVADNLKIEDVTPPEDFNPSIGNDPGVFDGRYFIAFTTQDKGVGIDHYEIREGFWHRYVKAESPYSLPDQSLTKTLYIKAVDKNGNARVVSMKQKNRTPWYQQYEIISILILVIYGFYFLRKKW